MLRLQCGGQCCLVIGIWWWLYSGLKRGASNLDMFILMLVRIILLHVPHTCIAIVIMD